MISGKLPKPITTRSGEFIYSVQTPSRTEEVQAHSLSFARSALARSCIVWSALDLRHVYCFI